MPKDYAKRPPKPPASKKRKKPQRTLPFRIRWVLLLIVLVPVIFALFYVVSSVHFVKNDSPVKSQSQQPPPSFVFDTVSPKMQLPAPSLVKAEQYVLQVGSTETVDEANRLKEQMILLGFDAQVTKQRKDGQVIQQVSLGPYHSLKAAKADQQRLSQYHINSQVVAWVPDTAAAP